MARSAATVTVLVTAFDDADGVDPAELTESIQAAVTASGGLPVRQPPQGAVAGAFTSASAAITAAVAVQQAAAHLARRPGGFVRVGLAIGEGIDDGLGWSGAPLDEAAAACAVAAPGEILATELVQLLTSGVPFEPRPPVAVDPSLPPMPMVALAWEPRPVSALPPVLAPGETPAVVGRDDELRRLRERWLDVVSGRRQVMLVGGEPGVGKSTLVAEFARQVHAEGAVVLFGRCDEDLSIPYQPFIEAFRHLVATAPLEDLVEHVKTSGGDLARLTPELVERIPSIPSPRQADGEVERGLLFAAAADLITITSRRAPILIVLDDVHWAARPTLLLLRHLVRASEGLPLAIAGTYRDTELGRTHPFAEVLADLRRQPDIERLSLSGLDEAGVQAVIDVAAGTQTGEGGRALARAVHAETDGNPFFVWQVLRHLVESRAIVHEDGRWQLSAPVDEIGMPEGVREVVGRRLSRLSADANRALAVAAVMGLEFDLELLEAVPDAKTDMADLLDALDEAMEARVVEEVSDVVGRYRFAHQLVRNTLYDELSTTRRARLHGRVGAAIETTYPNTLEHAAALARHFAEAAPMGDLAKAADYAVLAARRAITQLAYEDALDIIERGLQALELGEPPDHDRRAQLLLARSGAYERLTIESKPAIDAAMEASDAARMAGSAGLLAEAVWMAGRHAVFGAVDDADIERAEEALALLGDSDPRARSRVLSVLAIQHAFAARRSIAQPMADEALALATPLNDIDAIANCLTARFTADLGTADAQGLLRTAEQLFALGIGPEQAYLYGFGLRMRGAAHLILGDLVRADEDARLLLELAKDLRYPFFSGQANMRFAVGALIRGNWDDAERHASEMQSLITDPNMLNAFFGIHLMLAYERGSLANMVDFALNGASVSPQFTMYRVTAALMLAELARYDEARVFLDDLGADEFAGLSDDWTLPAQLSWMAEVAGHLDAKEHAEVLGRRLAPYGGQLIVTGTSAQVPGVADRYRAIAASTVGDPAADDLFASALELEDRIGARPFAARTRYWWARHLLAHGGDPNRVAELIDSCLATARDLGMQRLIEQVDELPGR